ncbi:MAG: ArsR/SmtB family transcription factor [Bryobacteraceae bacterium]
MAANLPDFFQALSDPTRLRILRLLMKGPHCVCEMEQELALPQPLLSRHLATLRHAGIVEGHRSGVRVSYRLCEDRGALRQFLPALRQVLVEQEPSAAAGELNARTRGSRPPARLARSGRRDSSGETHAL